MVSFFLIEMEYVTDFIASYLKERPIVHADLIREHENQYSIPFQPDLKNMKILKKIKLMGKFHYFAFYLLKEVKFGFLWIKTEEFENSVKYTRFTYKVILWYIPFETLFLFIIEMYHRSVLIDSFAIYFMKIILSICSIIFIITNQSYIKNCHRIVPQLAGYAWFWPLMIYKLCFIFFYLVVPHISVPILYNYSEWDQLVFNMNFVMAWTNTILAIYVAKRYKPYSLSWFESNNKIGILPTI